MSVARGQGSATILSAGSSPAYLSRATRRPRFALRRRPPSFHEAFEDRALFYDCFRHHDGRRVLLVGPPPVNLDYRSIMFEAGGTRLQARFHTSLSVTLTELGGVPPDADELNVAFEDDFFVLPIQPSYCADLEGRRLIFTMNRDNDLAWIREWAQWHAHHHSADAVVLFDNGSTAYTTGDIAATLAAVPGIRFVAVHGWPHKYGPVDPGVLANAYWARFLQIGAMGVALRRYGMRAAGILNCDIDELALTHSGTSIFDLARASPGGLVVFRGTWVEAQPEPDSPPRPPHRHYRRVHAEPKVAYSHQRKWALDPTRDWLQDLRIHPYMHWIEGRPRNAKSMPGDAGYFHFLAINTNWKRPLVVTPLEQTRRDPLLDAGFAELTQ